MNVLKAFNRSVLTVVGGSIALYTGAGLATGGWTSDMVDLTVPAAVVCMLSSLTTVFGIKGLMSLKNDQ